MVVDRDGETIVEMRGDNASPHTIENARRKAYTAMTFKQPTAEYAKKLQDPNSVAHQQVTLPNVIAIPGGVPIKAGDEIIGGVGASGSPGVRRRLRQRRARQGEGTAAVRRYDAGF